MASTRIAVLLVTLVGCVTPRGPAPAHPPAADRFQRIADPDPAVRVAATGEFIYDPSPDGVRMLLVVLERDRDPIVRAAAAVAIAERRDPSLAFAVERAAVVDPDPQARAAADQARGRLAGFRKRPGTAAGLSLLCPGCGNLYLGNTTNGALQLSGTAALVGGAYLSLRGHELRLDGTADSKGVPLGVLLAGVGQNLWFYSIFDAYRTARVMRDDYGYRHPITRESLADLAAAPFRPSVIKSPWVWLGVPLALAGGIGIAVLFEGEVSDEPTIFEVKKVNFFGRRFSRAGGFAAGTGYYAGLFTAVGVGEEALFRGVIQTELEERFGPTTGLIASSVIFGGVHAFNFLDDPETIAIAVPVITVLGTSLGLAYQRTGRKLSTSVAMHFWYDLLLSTFAFAADPNHQVFVVNYSSPM